jgi:hypothetical protein
MSGQERFDCPYCQAVLNGEALSCRCCGRDLTPVLPLLRRFAALELRLATLEMEARDRGVPGSAAVAGTADSEGEDNVPALETVRTSGRSRYLALPLGLAALLLAHGAVVLWLDLPLVFLRLLSLFIPLATGLAYFGRRRRVTWLDAAVAGVFALAAVAAMNAALAWADSIPVLPQGAAAWRETIVYALSIGASMYTGMLVGAVKAALTARGLASLPKLQEGILAANKNIPMDTLKAIEMTVLLVGTAFSAVTSLVAGLFGAGR